MGLPAHQLRRRLMPQVRHFKCPHCGQVQGGGAPPNFTTIHPPGGHTGVVVVLSCRNLACQAVIGTYPHRIGDVEAYAA